MIILRLEPPVLTKHPDRLIEKQEVYYEWM